MKNQRYRTFIYWGITSVMVIATCIALVFFLLGIESVKTWMNFLIGILMPIIYGAVLAYLLTPIFNRCVRWTQPRFIHIIKNEKVGKHLAKAVATVVSLIVIFVVVIGLFNMLIPELVKSIIGVIDTLPGNVENLSRWLQQLLKDNPDVEQTVLSAYNQGAAMVQNWMTTDLVPNLNKLIGGLSSGVISVLVLIKNILIGLIVMVYMLNIKEVFSAQGKKMIYSFLPLTIAKRMIEEMRFIHKVFGGFIIGKLLDSLIIGIICFVILSFMKMPYVLLVSVIVGVTNIIPFFGPFIGAVPSAILILLVSPVKCLYFLGFILLLQQFDGNILGPKILGDSTGLPSFWVLFSILLFGGLFGFVGMIIAVPTFAVFYNLISTWVCASLAKKELPLNTADYMDLDYIDEDKKTYLK